MSNFKGVLFGPLAFLIYRSCFRDRARQIPAVVLDIDMSFDVLYTVYQIPYMAAQGGASHLRLNQMVLIELRYLRHVVQVVGATNTCASYEKAVR